eukprot:34748-Pyramimonas_sp.AAC.1
MTWCVLHTFERRQHSASFSAAEGETYGTTTHAWMVSMLMSVVQIAMTSTNSDGIAGNVNVVDG